MKILFSPSKTMVISTCPSESQPIFLHEAQEVKQALDETLQAMSLQSFYNCHEKKAKDISTLLNHFSFDGRSPAVHSFTGLAFAHLHPRSLDQEAIAYLKEHLLIFSGLYGLLRPFDAISPYRLDYENPLKINGISLKTYWKDKLYQYLKDEALIINLASKEYASALLSYKNLNIVSIDFKLKKEEKYLSTSTEAKISRGELLRLLALSEAECLEDLTFLCPNGYYYSASESTQKNLVFIKKVT